MTTIAETLAAKGNELEAALARISAPAGDQSGISFGKRVGEGTSMAVDRISLVAAHDRLQAMLADVRRAQAKLGTGSYGECDQCKVEIPTERLQALPWATLCISCAYRR